LVSNTIRLIQLEPFNFHMVIKQSRQYLYNNWINVGTANVRTPNVWRPNVQIVHKYIKCSKHFMLDWQNSEWNVLKVHTMHKMFQLNK
jgi:hypothetical protein